MKKNNCNHEIETGLKKIQASCANRTELTEYYCLTQELTVSSLIKSVRLSAI